MAIDDLTLLSFVGIYFLLLGSLVYNFYLSKKLYQLLDEMVDAISVLAELKEPQRENTMKKLIKEGIKAEGMKEENKNSENP
jgi:hypothetical protein